MNAVKNPPTAPGMGAFWMPFTANRQFKSSPRMLARAEGMHYYTPEGRKILDATAGLWCVNAGHCRTEIADAVSRQAREMDFAPTFQMGHPLPFALADRLAGMFPGDLNHIFFTNSGSESVDTALKMALAYHRARGEGHRFRLIGRERGYHGVGFGGISVGGIVGNRKVFGPGIPGTDHLPHTHDLARNAFSRGTPEHGAELAEALERLVALHDASTIAAVIVEPIACSTGVLVPPKGYLERLRAITEKHGILLIFDEVITGFGRLGKPLGADYFGVLPDMVTTAKGLTNGTIPMGAVAARSFVHDAIVQGAENMIELFHGYTYSGHPMACAAALATLDIYENEKLFERCAGLEKFWEDAVHSLRSHKHVIDIRNSGLIGAIELESRPGRPGTRGYDALVRAFEAGLLIRVTGDIIALSPPLIVEREQIGTIIDMIGGILNALD